MKKQLLFIALCLTSFMNAQTPVITFTSAPLTTAQIGSTITVNYQYSIPSNGNIYCAINLYNGFTWSSMVVDGVLSPAPAGTNMTGSFNFTIPNGTTPTSNLTGNFNYKIVIELSNASWNWQAGAYPTDQINLTSNLSTSDFDKNTISVYPNPTSDFINLKGLTDETNFDFMISDMLGKVVLKNVNTTKIDVSTLAPGLYFLILNSDSSQEKIKFVKK